MKNFLIKNFVGIIIVYVFVKIGFVENIPPYTDYCAMLSQEIQNKKHAFLAGNLVYYIGGQYGVWNKQEDETIGLTHPFFHDLRSRGYGMVNHEATGYGHDLQGWEFYRDTKVAYGTVYVGSKKFTNPTPKRMYWRPDKVICQYNVGGVNIREEKFIALNDVVCTIITSDSPVTLEFEGQSYACKKSITKTATCKFDTTNNAIHVIEGGTVWVNPAKNEFYKGTLMYDGMSTVVSSTKSLMNYSQHKSNDQWFYKFKVFCDSNGVAILWAMDDIYENALNRVKHVIADPFGKMADKTQYMNDLLNHQIPYFRCSDQDVVNVYYYLWALYLMYYIDVGEGWEKYPHTQTAVNNFLGLHRYDNNFQIRVGSWMVDKEYYAYGNVLLWSALLPFADLSTGMVPADNMGKAWFNANNPGTVAGHVPGAWQIYQHSGDLSFLQQVYDFYKNLMWQKVPGIWGYEYAAAECLAKMANVLGYSSDANHWYDMVDMDNVDNWLKNRWEIDTPYFFGSSTPKMDWNNMAYMAMSQFPDDWASKMTEHWAVNDKIGYFGKVPLLTVALKDWDQISDVFTVTPDINWWAIRGMYLHHVGSNANKCALGHIKGYNLEWGIPIAPESRDINYKPWGDQYSNFNAGKILLILEGIAGLSYSIPDEIFTISDHLPKEWDYMELMVPITKNDQVYWTTVKITKQAEAEGIKKTVTVEGCPLDTIRVQPWLEDRVLKSASPEGYEEQKPRGHISYLFQGLPDVTVSVQLTNNQKPTAIYLDNLTVKENEPTGSLVSIMETKDEDIGDKHTYSLVSGQGSENNTSFSISNDSLLTAEVFDFEKIKTLNIRIRTTDEAGAYYEEPFTIKVLDVYEGPDSTVGDTLIESFNGPQFDLGLKPDGFWEFVGKEGKFNGKGQYTVETNSGMVGLKGQIGQGDFEAVFDVSKINWIADFSKVVWEIWDDDSNAIIFFVEKGDTWMSLIVDMKTFGQNSRKIQVPINIPKAIKLKVKWIESNKEWRFWYGLDGDDPTIEPEGSPIINYSMQSTKERWISLLVGQWKNGQVAADFDYFELTKRTPLKLDDQVSNSPEQYWLLQNYPNPFNQTTQIEFFLPKNEWVSLIIFDVNGRKIKSLLDQRLISGQNIIKWDGTDSNGNAVPSGIYFYKLITKRYQKSKKMILIK